MLKLTKKAISKMKSKKLKEDDQVNHIFVSQSMKSIQIKK